MKARSFFVLAYDIADPRRLARVAKAMEAVGERVQDSVFEAWLEEAELVKLLSKANKAMNASEDSLRVYVLCGECRGKIRCMGQGKPTPPPQTMIV